MAELKSLDICDDAFSHKRAVEALWEQMDRQICNVLLDQDLLPGVGNIIKNEVTIIFIYDLIHYIFQAQ